MIAFHRLLIGTAIVFCAAFSFWSVMSFTTNGSIAALVLGILFALATFALAYYLAHLKRFLGR